VELIWQMYPEKENTLIIARIVNVAVVVTLAVVFFYSTELY
jgi:FlaG/FlaF family flagellin (archaellin)